MCPVNVHAVDDDEVEAICLCGQASHALSMGDRSLNLWRTEPPRTAAYRERDARGGDPDRWGNLRGPDLEASGEGPLPGALGKTTVQRALQGRSEAQGLGVHSPASTVWGVGSVATPEV